MKYKAIIQQFPMEWQASLWELVETIQQDMQEQAAFRRQDLEALFTAVEELAETQRRTEERWEQLRAAVQALTEAQRRSEERISRLEAAVAELIEAQRRNEEQIRELIEVQRHHEERLQKVEKRLQKVEDRLADASGTLLEMRYREHAPAYFGTLLRRATIVKLVDLEEKLEERLPQEEVREVMWLDLIIQGQLRQPPLPDVLLAIEISCVVDRKDVWRARQRADLLHKAGYRAIPIAAGQNFTRGALAAAEKQKVALLRDSGRLLLWEEAVSGLIS